MDRKYADYEWGQGDLVCCRLTFIIFIASCIPTNVWSKLDLYVCLQVVQRLSPPSQSFLNPYNAFNRIGLHSLDVSLLAGDDNSALITELACIHIIMQSLFKHKGITSPRLIWPRSHTCTHFLKMHPCGFFMFSHLFPYLCAWVP
jgi:hypothetical protein